VPCYKRFQDVNTGAVELLLNAAYMCDRGLDPVVYATMYLGSKAEARLLNEDFVQDSIQRFVSGALHLSLLTFIDEKITYDIELILLHLRSIGLLND